MKPWKILGYTVLGNLPKDGPHLMDIPVPRKTPRRDHVSMMLLVSKTSCLPRAECARAEHEMNTAYQTTCCSTWNPTTPETLTIVARLPMRLYERGEVREEAVAHHEDKLDEEHQRAAKQKAKAEKSAKRQAQCEQAGSE